MTRISLSVLALLVSSIGHAADADLNSAARSSGAMPDAAPVLLDAFVVRDKLDKAREDIVPSLGAAEFQLDRSQIDALALGANAGFNEVLLRVPGVAQDSFGQVHLRGEHADLQYRINDVLLPEGLTGFGQELDARFVGTLSVLTGALPAQYGYRTAGVVDLHTRTDARSGGDITLYGGSFGMARASAEGTMAGKELTGYVTATAERTELGIENPTSAPTAIHDRKDQQRIFAYASRVIDETSRINVMLSGSLARFQIPNNPGQPVEFALRGAQPAPSSNLDENQREENHYAVVAYQKTAGVFSGQLAAFARYSLVAFAPDHDGDLQFNGVASRVRRSLVGEGFEADGKWEAAPQHTLRAGVLATATNFNVRTMTSVFATDLAGNQASDVPFDVADRRRKLGWLGGIYGQDEWKPIERVTVNYGLRADTSRGYQTESQLSPRLNVVYQWTADTTLHLGYARYFTPPPLELVPAASIAQFNGTTNQAEVTANSPVRAERAHYFDAGLATKLSRNLSATLDAYDKETKDVLDEGQFGQAVIFSPFNYREGRTYGVEFSSNYTHGAFSAYGNVALSRGSAREIVSGEFQFGADELGYIATHKVHPDHDQLLTASAGGSYRVGGTLWFADFLFGSGLRRGFANSEHLPPYHPLNGGVEQTFKLPSHRELRLRIDVVNLLDERYELRDGSGIGVGAPQFGMRRGLFGSATLAF